MSEKYNKLMENLKVTEAMHKRILQNIKEKERKIVCGGKFFNAKTISAAACVLLVFGLFSVSGFYTTKQEEHESYSNLSNGIAEASSISELSEIVGFEVVEIKTPPFEVKDEKYLSYWGNMAEIKYTGETQYSVFRQSLASDDISGDYDNYAVQLKRSINGADVLLKGNSENSFVSASWKDNDIFFYIRFSEPLTLEVYEHILSDIIA